MIFVDSSALIAILTKEPRLEGVKAALRLPTEKWITPIARLETTMVLTTKLNVEPSDSDLFVSKLLDQASIRVSPISEQVGQTAIEAFIRYGKGVGHPARLNIADCFIYAAARVANARLLFLCEDFIYTDIESVLDDPRPWRN